MAYNSPITLIAGVPQQLNYHPLSSVEDVKVSVNEGTENKNFGLWEILSLHIDNKLKLPNEIRNILLQVINPNISLTNRLEIPFTTKLNTYCVEVFWGNKRVLFYEDIMVNDLIRCVEIPYDESDPEIYLNSVAAGGNNNGNIN